MKNKKILSLIMTFVFTVTLLCSGATGAFAASGITDNELFDLKSFNIIEGDENGELHLEDNITRAEFTKIVAKLLNVDTEVFSSNDDMEFLDVPKSHWAYDYISFSSLSGYINGDGNGHFLPEDNITFYEAVKILVSVLGFGEEAEKNGGYPNGYVAMGAQIRLTRNSRVSGDEVLLRGDAFKLVYNALDADRLVRLSYGSESKIEISDETLRDILMGDSEEGLSHFKGTVTSNYDSWLISPNESLEEYEVEIDGMVFDKGNTNAEEYLGQEVDVYAAISPELQKPVIRQIRPTKENNVKDVRFEDIQEFSKSEITYQTEEEKSARRYLFKNSTVFLYNGKMVSDFSAFDVAGARNGYVRLISNQNSGSLYAQTVLINEYQSFTVDKISEKDERILLKGDDRFQNMKYINLRDDGSDDVKSYLMNADGAAIELSEIESGNIITVYASADGMLLKIYRCDEEVTGEVSELKPAYHKISVDGTEYEYESGISAGEMLGKKVIAKLNYLGKIATLELDDGEGELYGAIVDMALGGGLGQDVIAQVVLPGKIVDDKEDEGDDPSVTAVPLIAAQNSGVTTLNFHSKVTFNGTVYNDSDKLMSELLAEMRGRKYLPISYTLNSNDLVRKIDVLEEYTLRQNTKQYNAYEKTFAGTGGAFGLSDKTMALCVPTNVISSSKDYLARIEMNNNQNYEVNAYHYNKDTRCPDIVVFQSEMHYDTSGIAVDGRKIGLVEEIVSFVDDNGDMRKRVIMATAEEKGEFAISDNTMSSADFNSLAAGDLILYSLDAKDCLDGFARLESCDPIPGDYQLSRNNFDVFSGRTVDAEYKIVSNNLNKWVDTITVVGTGLNETVFEVQRDNPPPVYIWDSDRQIASIGTTDDFLARQEHVLIVRDTTGKTLVRAVVVII